MMERSIEINNIAVQHFLNREFEQAEERYNEALKINPESATVLNNLGLLYHQKKKYKKAAGYFIKAIQIEEKDTYCVNAGNAMACLNETEKAAEWYNKALELNADCINARESMANLLEYSGKSEEAAIYWAGLVNRTRNGKHVLEFVKNLMKRKKFKEALQLLHSAAPKNSSETWYLAGICEYELRNYGLAEESLKHSLGIDPDREEVRHYLAVTYLAAGNVNKALAEMDKILKMNPGNYHIITEKGVVLLSQNNHQEALAMFEQALALQPKFSKAIKYKEMAVSMEVQKVKSGA